MKTARTLSQISIRNSQSSSLLQKRAFQSISSIQAETTITTPKANLPFPSYPRSASSALLGLDVPDTFDSRLRPAYSEFGGKKVAGGSTGERQASSLRNSRNIESLMSRKWRSGDVYTPHDLTPREVMKFKTTKRPSRDIFDALGINPLDHYKVWLNFIPLYGV